MGKNKSSSVSLPITVFAAFGIFTLLVATHIFSSLDLKTTEKLQGLIPNFINIPFALFSLIGSAEITGILIVIIIFHFYKKDLYSKLFALGIFGFGTLLEIFGKYFLYHPSPPRMFFKDVNLIFPSKYIHTDYSYPSGHLFRTTFIIAFILFAFNLKSNRTKLFLLLPFLVLMLVSRVYLGEHWLTDTIGGLLLGFSFGLIAATPKIIKTIRS